MGRKSAMELSFEVTTKRLELSNPWTISRGTAAHKEYCYLKLEKGPLTAWGEAAHNSRYGESLDSVRAGLVSGVQLIRQHGLASAAAAIFAEAGIPRSAKAALDMALLDLEGQERGLTVRALLGAPDTLPPPTSFSIGIDQLETIRAKVLAAPDYKVLKIKLGTQQDAAIMQAVRAVTDQPLRVDANEGWKDPVTALRHIEKLAGQGVELIEQPLPAGRLEEVAWLRERSPLPLFADEDVMDSADIPRLAAAYHGINIKLMKSGGPREASRMMLAAREHGLRIMLGCMIESSCGISAAAHLSGAADVVDLDGHLLLAADPFTGLRLEEGRVRTGEAAGLGVRLGPEA
jgi:L-alanine-DL-glutamate epimerase-like enolase superfamily enzyme